MSNVDNLEHQLMWNTHLYTVIINLVDFENQILTTMFGDNIAKLNPQAPAHSQIFVSCTDVVTCNA
jgi:hypothetical protein